MIDHTNPLSPVWLDHSGSLLKTPAGQKLHFPKIPLHAALRAFVFIRDRFTCQWCGDRPLIIPEAYNGRQMVYVTQPSMAGFDSYLVIDHVLSRRNGGTNHPSNLQTLCDCCNATKSVLIDAKVKNGAHTNN